MYGFSPYCEIWHIEKCARPLTNKYKVKICVITNQAKKWNVDGTQWTSVCLTGHSPILPLELTLACLFCSHFFFFFFFILLPCIMWPQIVQSSLASPLAL